jgi:hypothetical protein
METKPNCYKCVHRLTIPGDCHSRCNNHEAKVAGNPHGIKSGWFRWPLNFDPTWLVSCDGFSDNTKDAMPKKELSPLEELLSILR